MRFSKRLKRSLYKILFLVIAGILVISLSNFYQKKVRNFVYKISEPFQKFFWKLGQKLSFFLDTLSEIKTLKEENERLKNENQKLLTEISLLKEVQKENQILREALNLDLAQEFNLLLAEVISKDISEDSILINKGEEDGIEKDFPVVTQQKILVGKVSEVYKNYSKIMLISNKKSSFDGKIAEKEILGQVKGKGSLKILFDLVPREKEIKKGDLIKTSALGGIFPAGLLVGEIEKVEGSDIEPFWRAEVSPFFELEKLEKVFVILSF
jgi:rod shape-determining protein MreC